MTDPKLHKCCRCSNSQAFSNFVWGYHFEPASWRPWCRTCQFGGQR